MESFAMHPKLGEFSITVSRPKLIARSEKEQKMAITVGDRIPEVSLSMMSADGPAKVNSLELLGKGKVVLFAVPGAFTPTCSDYHLPGFVLRADEMSAKGVETIACTAVNDAFVMAAWGDAREV